MITLKEDSTEFQTLNNEWKEQAHKQTLETLPKFLEHLANDYQHDYGTICHASAAAAIAGASAINNSAQGGITRFQAGAVMWSFIKEWEFRSNRTSLRLIDYDNMLYPQYAHQFEKDISRSIWNSIQKAAKNSIDAANEDYETYIVNLEKYKEDISVFVSKYPDYYTNKVYYDPLSMGISEQWEHEKIKRDSGFEFAPQEPYKPIFKDSKLYQHWQSIINGIVPFGFNVKD